MNKPQPRPEILKINPYTQGLAELDGMDQIIKLSSNESALGPSPHAIEALYNHTPYIHRYAEGTCLKLREAIGERYGLNPAQILCGAGSDELIAIICQAYAHPGDEVLYSEYGFLMYPISTIKAGATPVTAPEKDKRTDIEAMLKAVTDRTRIVFIANPNNPTGSYISDAEMREFRKRLPGHILLVIDSAYSEYATASDYDAGDMLAGETENTIVLHTFSKIYGLASLRLGWGYAAPSIIDVLNRVRGPFNVSGAAQAAGIAAVRDTEHLAKSRAHNSKWLGIMTQRLSGMGLTVYPSAANFLLVEFSPEPGKNADDADRFLKFRGIIARRMESYNLSECLRFSISIDHENEALLAALEEFTEAGWQS